MDKKRVSIYIATGVKGPHKKKSSYMYLLETSRNIKNSEKTETECGMVHWQVNYWQMF